MKKVLKWMGVAVLTPILLFLLLTALLYVPPIQNWAVDHVAAIASEQTGMQISVGHVALRFPLDLEVDDVLAVSPPDTLADIRRAVVDVKLLPLFSSRVEVDDLELNDARINTLNLVSDLQVRGTVNRLQLRSDGIALNEGTVALNGTRIEGADLLVLLSDTAAVDTTTSVTPWRIDIDGVDILRSKVEVHMPGDSMRVSAYMGDASIREGVVDLLNGRYRVGSIDWHNGWLTYDLPHEAPVSAGLDYNHISLSDINIGIDSVDFSTPNLSLSIRQAALREQSGLAITQLQGHIGLDSTRLNLPGLSLRTPYSNIYTRAKVDLNVMDSISPGQLDLQLKASLGKQDLLLFMADTPDLLRRRWPNWPLSVDADMSGNVQQALVRRLDITLPTAFHASASGNVGSLTDMNRLLADLDLSAEAYDLSLLTAFVPGLGSSYRIPAGMRLTGNVSANGPIYSANLTAHQGKGTIRASGHFNQRAMSYDADVNINQLNLHQFLPKDSLYGLTASIKLRGQGTDFLSPRTRLDADAVIHSLQYGHLKLDDMNASVHLKNGHALADITGCNPLFEGTMGLDALIGTKQLHATISPDLQMLDLYRLGAVSKPLIVGGQGSIEVESDLDESHKVRGVIESLFIKDSVSTYHPEKVGLFAQTQPDSTWVRLQSGDLIVKFDASGGYRQLIAQGAELGDTLLAQFGKRTIDQHSIRRLLPMARLYATSGRNNPIVNFLKTAANINFREMKADLTTSPQTGINGYAYLHGLNADSTRIDTISMQLKDTEKRLTFSGQVRNNRRNPQFVFNALFDGIVHEHGATFGVRYYDDQNRLGVRLGATAAMEEGGIRVQLMPKRPTLGYKEFNLNDDNFVYIDTDFKVQAKVDLIADDGTGVKVYSEADQDSTLRQDITVSLKRFNLGELTSVLPYMPRISGLLDGDYHLMMDQQQQISVASDMQIAGMTYEGCPMGNLSTEFVYMQREDDTHAVEGVLSRDGTQIGTIRGSYRAATKEVSEQIDAKLTLARAPMMLVNGFIPDQLIGFEGYAEGVLDLKGSLSRPLVNGEVYLDSAYLVSQPYGVRLRFDNDPVRIQGSKLLLENFTMYAYNDNPLNIMGDIDFSNLDRMTMNVRMRAQDYQLINSKQTAKSIAYGKAFVNFFARMQGPMDQLQMRGRLDVLGSTDLTYLLLDSPLSTDNQMDELVKFTDFTDSTLTIASRPEPSGLNVDMTINVDQGAHVMCGLNSDLSNYIDLFGGGDLRMRYNNDGISISGRYTLSSGEMKYSLPVIPLKTFNIQDGSYVEFTGDPMNPRLNITATERTKAAVSSEGSQSRSVAFDCGVVITRTLNDMGLEFIINAPEDNAVSNELASMSTEQRGKLAVTMLTTGMYLADGNTSGFSMNSALSSFLQSEINNITGNALKTLDLSIGLDNTTDASGVMHTDYSFKFAKRFWNNRLKVQIGGKVSTGAEAAAGQQQSFFDNVTMEYRLTPTSNQYVSLFYNQNAYDWLEGYTGEYGGGYMWKRKLDSFWDIFKIWGKEQQTLMPQPARNLNAPRDTTKTASNDTIQ